MAARKIRISAHAAGCFAVLAGGLAYAAVEELDSGESSQVVTSKLQDRVEDRVVPESAAPQAHTGTPAKDQKLTAGVEVDAGYDDNIFLTPNATKKSDAVLRIAPSATYVKGDPSKTTADGGYVRIAYKPAAIFFQNHPESDHIDQKAELDAGWRAAHTKVEYSGAAQRLADPAADTGGGITKRLELHNTARVTLSPDDKISWQIAAGQSSTDYDSPRFFDSREYYGEGVMLVNFSPKTQVGMGWRAGVFKVDGAGRQLYEQATGRLHWQPREKILVEVQAGLEHREFDAGSSNKPVAEARMVWLPRSKTEVYLSAYRRETASAFFAGENYTTTGGSLGVSQKIGDRWTARLEGGVEQAVYTRVSGMGASDREDHLYFLKPSLEYQFTDQFHGGVFYRFNKNSSNDSAFGYDDSSAGVQLGYEF